MTDAVREAFERIALPNFGAVPTNELIDDHWQTWQEAWEEATRAALSEQQAMPIAVEVRVSSDGALYPLHVRGVYQLDGGQLGVYVDEPAAHPAPVERVALSDEQIDAAKVVPDCIRDELPDDLAVRRVQIWAAGLVAAERKAWVEALVAAGLMTKRGGSALSGWDAVYTVTAEGKAAASSKAHNAVLTGARDE